MSNCSYFEYKCCFVQCKRNYYDFCSYEVTTIYLNVKMSKYRNINILLLSFSVQFLQSCCASESINTISVLTDSPLNTNPSLDDDNTAAVPVFSAIPTATEGPILDDVQSLYLNLTQYPGEACNRICITGQQRACFFEFNLENYQAMGVWVK